MSAPGRPKRESLPLGGTARSAKGAHQSAPGRHARELLPLGASGTQRERSATRARRTAQAISGFTLIEMMVAIALLLVVMAGVSGLYLAHRNARIAEELSQTVEAELRLGMDKLLFTLRNAPYGASWGNPTLWVTWITPSFTGNPMIVPGADASTPDTLSVASCTSTPIDTLAGDADATTLTVNDGANFDNSSRSVIMISDAESAKILSVSGNTINIDTVPDDATDPLTNGPQGVSRIYRIGTPICRVDVVTYAVCPPADLNPPVTCPINIPRNTLYVDYNQSPTPPQVFVDGITNMKVATDTTGVAPKYTITLTARASATDPLTTTVAQRSLTSIATARINN